MAHTRQERKNKVANSTKVKGTKLFCELFFNRPFRSVQKVSDLRFDSKLCKHFRLISVQEEVCQLFRPFSIPGFRCGRTFRSHLLTGASRSLARETSRWSSNRTTYPRSYWRRFRRKIFLARLRRVDLVKEWLRAAIETIKCSQIASKAT